MVEETPKKVFISYSWNPKGHKNKTLKLTNSLRRDRVDCMIDQGVFPQPEQGWILWTQQQVENADFVIVVCSQEYKEAEQSEDTQQSENTKEPNNRPGKGVAWEAKFIRDYLYNERDKNKKIIPIAFEPNNRNNIPFGMRSSDNFYELLDEIYDPSVPGAYQDLLRHIHGKPYVKLAPLGKIVPDLPLIDSELLETESEDSQSKGAVNRTQVAPLIDNLEDNYEDNYDTDSEQAIFKPATSLIQPITNSTLSSHKESIETNKLLTKRILVLIFQKGNFIDLEVRTISEAINESSNRDDFLIEERMVSSFESVKDIITKTEAEIIHCCSDVYVNEGELAFPDTEKNIYVVTPAQWAELFRTFTNKIQCVILSGCYSKIQAIEISKYVEYVIGVSNALDIKSTTEFIAGFYEAIGAGQTIEFSYEIGCNAIQMAGNSNALNPVLKKKSQQNTLRKLLIVAANPVNTLRIRLDKEIRDIKRAIRRAPKRQLFQLETVLAARASDLRRAMLDFRPQIVHFCGHGSEEGLAFEDEEGQAVLVNTEALAHLFKLFSKDVECVVFGTCFSEIQARSVAQYIDYVVGMHKEITDRAAIEFSIGFYDAIGAGTKIDIAYKLGCAAISLLGSDEGNVPVLIQDPSLDINDPLNKPVEVVNSLYETK